MSSSATTIKIYFTLPSSKQEIRRFTTSEKEIFPALLRFLESTYSKFFEPPLRFLIQYDDGEDLLTVSSEVELQEGLSLHAASGGGSVLKLLCRFDDSPVSTLHSPTALSGMSTPSVRLLADFPPSPSMTAAASQVDVLTRGDSTDSTVQVEQPVSEKEPLHSAISPKSDEEDIVDVHGSASDDEYVRIEESAPQKAATPVAAVATPQPVAVAQPVVETPAKSEMSPPAPVAVVAEVDPFAPHMEERAPERWACRLCTKQFRARHFLVEHLKRHFPADHFNKQAETEPVTTTTTTSTASAGTSTEPQASSEFATQTASTVSETSSTQTAPVSAESTATQTTETAPVACTSPPLVDETPAAPAAVEISDVTGHHEHCDASPEPSSIVEPTTTPTSSTSSSTPSDVVVHHGVTCDGCGQSPLTGNRYHCTVCTMPGGYDLCESCERSGSKHPQEHVFLKMRTPAHIPVGAIRVPGAGRCPMRGAAAPTGPRPRAAFVSDVTLADGLHVHAGETLRKVWSLKNVGDAPWPLGTRLVFAGGDLAPDLASGVDATAALVPFAGPGEVVHVAIDIIVPNEPGRFRSTFRLESPDGSRFGPRVWIDVIVPQEEQQAAPQEVPQPAAAAPVVTLPVAQPVVKSVAASSPPLQSAPAPAPAPAPAAAESKQNEEAALASELAAVQVEPAAEKPKAPQFQYSNQLATLRSMGFRDVELCRYLLLNNQGDLEKAVSWLLANAQ